MDSKKMMYAALAAFTCFCSCKVDQDVKSAAALAERVLSEERADHFRFEKLSCEKDSVELEQDGRKLVIRGNNVNSMAYGLNYYLNNYCHTTVSWYKDDALDLPESFPPVPGRVALGARAKDRFFLNYCTYGYTMPWWHWEDWEWLIDWMALHGVTMPLSITGQESTMIKVWERFGVPAEKTRESFTGPSFLPWNRIMDIDKWMGPLPQKWIDSQEELQKKIIARERELGMKPVLPAFNGHVPGAFAELYPQANIKEVTKWDGFEPQYGCWFLDPEDPLFGQIQKVFLEEQEKLYGTSHIYGLDIFNEVHFFNEIEGEEWDPQILAKISKHVYETLTAADPQAVWLQVGWMLYHDAKHWGQRQVEAYLTAVPQGKVAMLDYFCDEAEIYALNRNFYGQPYYFCFLGNFGGNTNLSGDYHQLSAKIERVFAQGGENLLGLGATLEGFGVSQWLYEFLFDRAWNTGISDEEWINALARRHSLGDNDGAQKAWKKLSDDIYTGGSTYSGICPVACLHPCFEGHYNWTMSIDVPYGYKDIMEVFKALLETPSNTDFYRFDLVNIGSEAIKLAYHPHRDAFTRYYRARDVEGMKRERQIMRDLYSDWERLLACHSTFSLERWIDQARSWGDTPQEKDYYEKCARLIITTWGGTGQLTDYANRQWTGMITSYYQARWEMFWDEAIAAVEQNREFDEALFAKDLREFELSWGEPDKVKISYSTKGDALKVASEIYNTLLKHSSTN